MSNRIIPFTEGQAAVRVAADRALAAIHMENLERAVIEAAREWYLAELGQDKVRRFEASSQLKNALDDLEIQQTFLVESSE